MPLSEESNCKGHNMTSQLNQKIVSYPVLVEPRVGMTPGYCLVSHFDLDSEDWGTGSTAVGYRGLLESMSVKERQRLYELVLDDVIKGSAATTSLLAFAVFEPHLKIVCNAVRDYVTHRSCNIEDEFAGVHEVVGVLANPHTVNKGAVLAGLVSIGDRRINAVARTARHLLSPSDIQSFSRVQETVMRTSTVEFCLDWLLELNQHYCREAVTNVACALLLMVVHDEQGIVEDLSEINYVGFKTTEVLQTQDFESYYSEISPILNYLKKCEKFRSVMMMVIDAWDGHRLAAAQLRNSAA